MKGKIEFRKSKFEYGMETLPSREEVALSLGERVNRDGAFTGHRGPGGGFFRSQALASGWRMRLDSRYRGNDCHVRGSGNWTLSSRICAFDFRLSIFHL